MTKQYQVVGIGNAMVDILAQEKDSFLAEAGVEKGIMQLIDMDRAVDLYSRVGPAQEISGGSAANTIAGIAKLGGRTAYVGKVKDDQLGAIFAHDLRAQGADYETTLAPKDADDETGRCIVIVTPDGERSMNTYLGVTEFLTPDDIDVDQMTQADWISLTLSDPFCVERHRDAFRDMIRDHVDLLFCNRAEMLSMYQTEDFDAALTQCASEVEIVACTDAENGAHILQGDTRHHIAADPVKIVDATGAGDMFAGAFLWGLTNGYDLPACGAMGNIAAGEIISHIGARAQADVKDMFAQAGLL